MSNRDAGRQGLNRMFLIGTAVLAYVVPGVAFAQDEDAGAEDGNAIIVTATKREATLQETPVAVTVTTAETLAREEIRDLKDLQTVVPSLRVTQLQSSANTNFIIRGFGNGANNAGIEPSVGVFVDGVYRSRTASQISDLPDVSRIEVLRGPQSTLFGKNASAGVISIVTRKPSFDFEGGGELSYGNYDAVVARGYVTGPVGDIMAASLSAGYARRDGYAVDLGSNTRTNERNRWFVRGQMLFDDGGPLTARIIADYDKIDENCCGVVNVQPSPYTQAIQSIGGQVNDPTKPFGNVVYNNFPSTNAIENYGISGQFDWDVNDVLTLTSISSYRQTHGDFGQDVDFTSADLLFRDYHQKLHTLTQELRFNADLDRVQLLGGLFYFDESVEERQQVGYGADFRKFANVLTTQLLGQSLMQAEGLVGALQGDATQYIGKFFTQGVAEGGRFMLDDNSISLFAQADFEIVDGLTLTLGGNYTKDKKQGSTQYQSTDIFSNIDLVAVGNTAIVAQAYPTALSIGVCLQVPIACAGSTATQAEIAALANGTSPAGVLGQQAYPLIAAGALAQAQGYADLNDTNPDVNSLLIAQDLQLFPRFVNLPNSVESGKRSDDNFSYTVRLAYDVNPDLNFYASYATGFKAASFALSRDSRPAASNATALASAGLLFNNQTFGSRFADPEKSEVFELGMKGNWGRFSLNLDGFRQDINGFQSNIFTGQGFILSNAGKQRTWGVELESTANPIDPLTINFAVTWLDPTYVSFPLSSVGDLSGTRPSGIPTWTVVLGGQWEQDLGNGDQLVLRSTYHFESRTQVIEGLPGFLDPRLPDGGQAQAIAAAAPYTRQVDDLSASITYIFDDPQIELSIWGRNLLNDRYLLSLFDSPGQPGSISSYPNQPRTYGATARFRF